VNKQILKLLATCAVLAFASAPASAYELTNDPDCGAISVFDPMYDACVGAYLLGPGENDVTDGEADNIVNEILNDLDTFGAEDWTFLEKDDNDMNGGCLSLTGVNSTAGSLSICDNGFDWPIEVVVSFKSANSFSLYYWSALAGPPGVITWSVLGVSTNQRGNPQDLSHASVYFRDTPQMVAEPATLGLFGIGLLGLAAARRRKLKT
jgi:hypothetical protein